jgi:hypothetical protein
MFLMPATRFNFDHLLRPETLRRAMATAFFERIRGCESSKIG